jgi:hypothetical protein
MEELPTERTAMRMTAFMTLGRPLIDASRMAMTKGEALASVLLDPRRRGSSYGTRSPAIVSETR